MTLIGLCTTLAACDTEPTSPEPWRPKLWAERRAGWRPAIAGRWSTRSPPGGTQCPRERWRGRAVRQLRRAPKALDKPSPAS